MIEYTPRILIFSSFIYSPIWDIKIEALFLFLPYSRINKFPFTISYFCFIHIWYKIVEILLNIIHQGMNLKWWKNEGKQNSPKENASKNSYIYTIESSSWNSWYQNFPFSIKSVKIVNSKSEKIYNPTNTFSCWFHDNQEPTSTNIISLILLLLLDKFLYRKSWLFTMKRNW